MSSVNNDEEVGQHALSISAASDFSDIFSHTSYNSFGTRPRNADRRVSFGQESTCSGDIVKVEITDLECNGSTNITIGALRRCKRHIVSPFYICLKFVGWRQFGYGRVFSGSTLWKVFNYSYLAIIICLLLFNYVFTVVACNARLVTETDERLIIPQTTYPTEPPHHRTSSIPWISMVTGLQLTTTDAPNKDHERRSPTTCTHVFTTYIVPNFLHLLAYFLGFLHFRVRSNEDLDSLMEKVFLYCEATYLRHVSQKMLIQRLKTYLYFLAFWTVVTVAVHILCDVCASQDKVPLIDNISNKSITIVLFVIDMIGTLISVGVSMTIILNYIVNCELIIFYAKLVLNKLRERSLNLRVAIKDLYQINMATKRLNSTTSLITSLILLICLERIAIGTSIMTKLRIQRDIVWAYRALYVLIQIPLLVLPLVQASRVNSFCSRFRRTVLEIRTFGYQNAPQIELDSVVLFSKANKFRAKLFFVPIQGSYLIMITIAATFIFILLVQNGYITNLSFI